MLLQALFVSLRLSYDDGLICHLKIFPPCRYYLLFANFQSHEQFSPEQRAALLPIKYIATTPFFTAGNAATAAIAAANSTKVSLVAI
jgi:hypothetical protein